METNGKIYIINLNFHPIVTENSNYLKGEHQFSIKHQNTCRYALDARFVNQTGIVKEY